VKGTILDFLNLATEKPELARELAELAKRHDFEFSDDVSDEDLEAVAGGTTGQLQSLTEPVTSAQYQQWQEKANQVDQQLTSVLRTMKDIGRVGVGGSDLGAS
jgi:glucose-6-phosphate isomerase